MPTTESPVLMQRLEAIQKILMAHYEAGVSMPSATKGSERETLVREFFRKVQPSHIRFGSGSIVDGNGNQSGQIDVVAEFPFLPSFPTVGADERLYLAESVSFVVEVKSDLGAQWAQMAETTKKIRLLRREWEGHLSLAGSTLTIHDPSMSRIPVIAVGYKGPATPQQLTERLLATDEASRPDAALVIDKGAYASLLTDRKATGAMSLFAFSADMAHFALNVLTAQPNLNGYLTKQTSGS